VEMPEGWKRFDIATDKDSGECYKQYDCEIVRDLMKEMAEALEAIELWLVEKYINNYEDLKIKENGDVYA